MCGIAGLYAADIDINEILRHQHHRGPDNVGVEHIDVGENILTLGHNRLKIICLDDIANQPFWDGMHSYCVVFNGEIYNYCELREELITLGFKFRTTSDTEVLLNAIIAWGIDALSKLNGMFAAAFYDLRKRELLLFRDRFGVKPIYYFNDGKRLVFASSAHAIAKSLNLEVNYEFIKRGISYGIYEDSHEACAFKDIKALQPGTCVRVELNYNLREHTHRYYNLGERVKGLSYLPGTDWQECVVTAIEQSSHIRMRADVEVAVSLSGGLDSSIVSLMAKNNQENIQAFCLGSPDDLTSEGIEASLFAKQNDLKVNFIMPDVNSWVDGFMNTIVHQEAPFAGISVVAQNLLYQHIKKANIKVVLGGQGGDEAFLGYRKFHLFYLRELLARRQYLQLFRFFISFSQMLWAERNRLATFYKIRQRYIQKEGQQSALNLPGNPPIMGIGESNSLNDRQLLDITDFSLPTLLRYEDRNSMASSIESRLPFMDYRLIELACLLPVEQKLKHGFGKWILRDSFKSKIPKSICMSRAKRGFDVGQREVLRRALHIVIEQTFAEHRVQMQEFLTYNLDSYFTPDIILSSPQRFTEFTTLVWLARVAM